MKRKLIDEINLLTVIIDNGKKINKKLPQMEAKLKKYKKKYKPVRIRK
jgi:hypothetical protein